MYKKQKKAQAEKTYDRHVDYLTHNYGTISQCIPYLNVPDSVFVFEESRYIVIGYAACRFESILSVRLDIVSPSWNLRDIALGGMLFGWMGAWIAANNSSNDDDEYVVSITVDSLSNPVIRYSTDDYNIANRLVGIIQVIIDRNRKRALTLS